MKNSKIIVSFLLAMLSLSACVKDNSNEKFNKLNEITISGIEDSYEPLIGDRLEINPTVTATDKENLSYVWYLYSGLSDGKRDTLSTEENLDVVIGGANAIPGNKYTLVYRVIDNKTGIFAYQHTKFTSRSIYSKGTMVLYENENQVELGMILTDGRVLENLYPLNNDGAVLNNAYREVQSINAENSTVLEMRQVCLFADDASGGVVLDPVTLTKIGDVRDMFDDEINTPVINVTNYMGRVGQVEYIFLNNKVCKRATNTGTIFFEGNPLVVSNMVSDFSIDGSICHTTVITDEDGESEDYVFPVFYDGMNGRVVLHVPYNMGVLIRPEPEGSQAFDVDNIGNYDYVSGGTISAELGMWLLLRDKQTRDLVMFRFNINLPDQDEPYATVKAISKTVITSAIAPNITGATHFIVNPKKQSPNCMYVSNNKVYSMNVSMVDGSNRMAEMELVAPINMTITGAKYFTATLPDPTPDDPEATKACEQIRLCVQDNSLSSKKGGVIFYEITTTGGLKLVEYSRKVGGFCDKIISISEKED